MGLEFPTASDLPRGLKERSAYRRLATLGFGFVRTRTATPRPQPGNPSRACSLPARGQALVNRMGFNNDGVDFFRPTCALALC
jgi:dihydroorotate dehydrogenase